MRWAPAGEEQSTTRCSTPCRCARSGSSPRRPVHTTARAPLSAASRARALPACTCAQAPQNNHLHCKVGRDTIKRCNTEIAREMQHKEIAEATCVALRGRHIVAVGRPGRCLTAHQRPHLCPATAAATLGLLRRALPSPAVRGQGLHGDASTATDLARMSCSTTCSAVGLSASVTSTAAAGPSSSSAAPTSLSTTPPSLGMRSPSPYHRLSFGPATAKSLMLSESAEDAISTQADDLGRMFAVHAQACTCDVV